MAFPNWCHSKDVNTRRLTLLVLLLFLAAAGAFLVLVPREPNFQGRRLSLWVQDLPYSRTAWPKNNPAFTGLRNSQTPPGRGEQAEEAVRQIGTNALPWLVGMLREKDSPLKLQLIRAVRQQSFIQFHFVSANSRRFHALIALQILGPEAKPAIPALTDLLNRPETAEQAASALAAIGPEAGPPLAMALTNSNPAIRMAIGRSFEHAAPGGLLAGRAKMLAPLLVPSLHDPDVEVRCNAAQVLGLIQEPAIVVPALVAGLADEDSTVRFVCAESLGGFQTQTRPVVIALMAAVLNDPDLEVRMAAAASLRKIYLEKSKTPGGH